MRRRIYYTSPAELPPGVDSLRTMLVLPLTLAAFFAMLAVATVAHALATTVKRRRGDLAVLRSMGFTRTDVRLAVAFQATLLAAVGVVLGVPAGIVVGTVPVEAVRRELPGRVRAAARVDRGPPRRAGGRRDLERPGARPGTQRNEHQTGRGPALGVTTRPSAGTRLLVVQPGCQTPIRSR